MIAAVIAREDACDALVSRHGYTLDQLPHGATVATSSLRRQAQLLHRRPDLRIVSVRGNVDTRLRKAMADDGPDAMVLAAAGLKRLGLQDVITEELPVDVMVPAAGQGALAVEVRASDTRLRRLVRRIDDPLTHRAVLAERAVLATLGGGCMLPMGAHAIPSADGADAAPARRRRVPRWPPSHPRRAHRTSEQAGRAGARGCQRVAPPGRRRDSARGTWRLWSSRETLSD